MNITSGVQSKPIKAVVYGPEGIGKSTFASRFPAPLFIDTEGSTSRLDVARTDIPSSLAMLTEILTELRSDHHGFKTLVLDTADWTERICIKAVCDKAQKTGIEEFGYGKGYTYVYEEMGRILNLLNYIWESGMNIVITAHAAIRKFEQPDEMGAYDRWELKLINSPKCNVCAMLKEWADMVLFANYKTYSVAVDKEGKKRKAQGGGERVMYTTHNPCWDAKNRFDLPPELPFDFGQIAHLFGAAPVPAPAPHPAIHSAPQTRASAPAPVQQAPVPVQQAPAPAAPQLNIPDTLPQALKDLMVSNGVDESDIRLVVSQRGYFPYDTPLTNYPPDFIEGVLIAAWGQMLPLIKENQKEPFTDGVPF
ncbi:MAG: ATP-binding protein [Ruminococcus sp.]|nr:ATP-binding protein [Ruminococcus sp.]